MLWWFWRWCFVVTSPRWWCECMVWVGGWVRGERKSKTGAFGSLSGGLEQPYHVE